MSEQEDFEFRMRMEQEAEQEQPVAIAAPPTSLEVAANAAAKGAAGFADMFLNAPVNAYNLAKAGAVALGDVTGFPQVRENLEITPQPNLVETGMRAVGAISEAREPQTAGQRILDMAVQTGVNVAASPASGVMGVVRNAALGATSGALAGATKEATGSDLAAAAVGMAVPLVTAGVGALGARANAPILKNPTKLQTAKEGMAAGYVVPPSHLRPTTTTQTVESFGGKAATKQAANAKNVAVTDRLIVEELGLPSSEPLTPAAVQGVRNAANKVYETVSNLSTRAKYALERLKQTRAESSDHWKDVATGSASGRVEARKAAVSADAKAAQLERVLDREAVRAGQPTLIKEFRDARTTLAKIHNIEDAMNVGDGQVSASYLGKLLDNGKPLTGNLKIIGKFAQAFPEIMRDASRVHIAGVSALDAAAMIGLGTAGYYGSDDPRGIALAAIPLLRGPARAMLLSKGYQNRLLKEAPGLSQSMLKSVLAGRTIAEAP